MANERIRRPALDRTQAIRGSPMLFGVPAGPGAKTSTADPASGRGGPEPTSDDVVSRSVDLGYRVIDDYIDRGQKAAERVRRGAYGPDALAEDVQDVAARMVQYVSDFSATWLEFLERTNGNGRAPVPPAAGPSKEVRRAAEDVSAPAATTAAPAHWRVELETDQRAAISLDVDPVSSLSRVVVHALRSTDPSQPRIENVSFRSDGSDRGTVRVRIPHGHPVGSYSGLIVDEQSNLPVGTLTVRLDGQDPGAPGK